MTYSNSTNMMESVFLEPAYAGKASHETGGRSAHQLSAFRNLGLLVSGLVAMTTQWIERNRVVNELDQLDANTMENIGVTAMKNIGIAKADIQNITHKTLVQFAFKQTSIKDASNDRIENVAA